MSAKDPIRLADLPDALPDGQSDLALLQSGVRSLRSRNGTNAQTEALAARLGAELSSNVVAGTAVLSHSLLRFMLIGVGVVGVSLGSWLLWNGDGEREAAAARNVPLVAQPRQEPIAQLGAKASPAPEIPEVEAANAPEIVVQKASSRIGSRPRPDKPRAASSDPEAELVLLGRAQALLDRDPNAALGVLGEHSRSYARGVFIEEREVLALEAESKLGHKALARARAERFVAQFPRSAHARRVRTLLEPAP